MRRSHPAWDAWIEILIATRYGIDVKCRIPHGMRGLKSPPFLTISRAYSSHPAWDAWIEIH